MSITPPKPPSCVGSLAPKHQRLLAVIEQSLESVEAGPAGRRPDVVDLQRRAIAALQQCAAAAIDIAERVGDTACPRNATCLHLGDGSRCNACFEGQVGKFLDQAGKFVTAVLLGTEPRPFGFRRAAEPGSKSFDAFSERSASFTEAQQRVFELLVTGLPNKLIAREIGVSEATVKAHVSAVLHKLGVRSRAQAIAVSSAFERNRYGASTSPFPRA